MFVLCLIKVSRGHSGHIFTVKKVVKHKPILDIFYHHHSVKVKNEVNL